MKIAVFMVSVSRQFSKSIFFSEIRSELDFNLDMLILWLCIWPFAKENVLTRICSVRRSSRRFKPSSILTIVSVDFLLIVDIYSRIIQFLTKVDTMLLQSILVVGTLLIVFKWHSATLNINVTLSTFYNPPPSNISICLCSGKDKFSPEHFPVIKNDKHSCW